MVPKTKTRVRKRKKERKSRRVLFYSALLLLFTMLAWGYKSVEDYMQQRLARFELEDIRFRGNEILAEEELLKRLGFNAEGETKLLEIKPQQVEELLQGLSYVRAVHAVHSLPSTLRIVIQERQPVAFLLGRGLNLVDGEGFILPVPDRPLQWDIPVIRGISEKMGIQGSYTSSASLQQAVQIASYMRLMPALLPEMVSEIDMSDARFVQLRLNNGKTALRIEREEYQQQLYKAALYLQEYMDYKKIDDIQYVDVRFAGQVVIGNRRG